MDGGLSPPPPLLHMTVLQNKPLVLALFLSLDLCNVEHSLYSNFGRNISHEAANHGSFECLKLLLELGHQESIASSSSSKSAAFSILETFRRLARNVRDQPKVWTPLQAARSLVSAFPLTTRTQRILREQADSKLQSHHYTDSHGNTPLHWAAFQNQSRVVQLLLEFGADANAVAAPSGWTPLHDAAYANATDCIQILINAGANVNARATSGATPLCFSAQEDAAEATELLLIRGADMTIRCTPTSSSIVRTNMLAASRTTAALQPPTRHNNHNNNTTTNSRFSGYTPLHYCAHYNAQRTVKILLQHHTAKVQIRDLYHRLPIHVAAARGSSAVLREFLRAGVQLQQQHVPLRTLIPSQPVQSSKPWNCLSQRSIDECRQLIHVVERPWDKHVHKLFTPADRNAVAELLRVGKRLELSGSVAFAPLWCEVLSFCGRGWFEVEADDTETSYDAYGASGLETISETQRDLPSFC